MTPDQFAAPAFEVTDGPNEDSLVDRLKDGGTVNITVNYRAPNQERQHITVGMTVLSVGRLRHCRELMEFGGDVVDINTHGFKVPAWALYNLQTGMGFDVERYNPIKRSGHSHSPLHDAPDQFVQDLLHHRK